MDALDGLHPGAAEKALVNSTPSLANLSNVGVKAALYP
jgi:hypothetical protein